MIILNSSTIIFIQLKSLWSIHCVCVGIGDMLSGAVGKAATDAAANKAAEQALSFGKGLLKWTWIL